MEIQAKSPFKGLPSYSFVLETLATLYRSPIHPQRLPDELDVVFLRHVVAVAVVDGHGKVAEFAQRELFPPR